MDSVIRHPSSVIRLATRQSPLALAQANIVAAALAPMPTEILSMLTSGDKFVGQPLAEIGGKGLFTKEIEEALLDNRADIAVHSCKDMPTQLPDGLIIGAYLPREDARDVLIGADSIAALPEGAIVGTSSLRRGVQLRHIRPDIQLVPLRGNVQTRLRKIAEGEAQATLLAMAGLKRLKLDPLPGAPVPIEEMLPAVCQGIIAIECREDDANTRKLLASIDHAPTRIAAECERTVLAALDGSCKTPIAAYAEIEGETIHLRAFAASADVEIIASTQETAHINDAVELGKEIGARLRMIIE